MIKQEVNMDSLPPPFLTHEFEFKYNVVWNDNYRILKKWMAIFYFNSLLCIILIFNNAR